MSGGPRAGSNLPWKPEVLLRGRGLPAGERAQLRKASREGPGAAPGKPPRLSFLHLSACTLTVQPTVCSQPWVQSRCHTHRVLKKPVAGQTGGLRGQLETKGESPPVPSSLASKRRGAVSAEMLALGRAQSCHPGALPGSRGRGGLPRRRTRPPSPRVPASC